MNLLIRADASPEIGSGHVMRCLALAQAWIDSGENAALASANLGERLEVRFKIEGIRVLRIGATAGSTEDAEITIALARRFRSCWVVVDGYQFGTDYLRMLKEAGLRLLVIDDTADAKHYFADFILNPSFDANIEWYSNRETSTRLLLGPRYALLRREFLKWRGWTRAIPNNARNLLVIFGGADPGNSSMKAIAAMRQIDRDLQVVLLAGEENPRYDELCQAARQVKRCVRIEQSPPDVSPFMAWADVAFSAAGSTIWELGFMGLPSVILTAAENQMQNAVGFKQKGASAYLGREVEVDSTQIANSITKLLASRNLRTRMTAACREIVDGGGSSCVVAQLASAK